MNTISSNNSNDINNSNNDAFESHIVVSRHAEAATAPLAFFETDDGYVVVRWSASLRRAYLQYVRTAEPGDPYLWCVQTDAPVRQSLANVLDLDSMPKRVALDRLVFHEAPVGSHAVDGLGFLESHWSDLVRDRITVTANLAFDNSDHDRQTAFNNILNRQLFYRQGAAFARLRAPYESA